MTCRDSDQDRTHGRSGWQEVERFERSCRDKHPGQRRVSAQHLPPRGVLGVHCGPAERGRGLFDLLVKALRSRRRSVAEPTGITRPDRGTHVFDPGEHVIGVDVDVAIELEHLVGLDVLGLFRRFIAGQTDYDHANRVR